MAIKKRSYLLLLIFLVCLSVSVQAQLKPGSIAPALNITNWINATPENYEKKFIVLDFWATWCAPCLAALPHLNNLQQQFAKNTNIVFFSLTDEPPERIKKILNNFYFRSYIISDTTHATQNAFEISSIPKTFLIDSNGIIRWIGEPKELTVEMLRKLFDNETIKSSFDQSAEDQFLENRKLSADSLFKAYRKKFDDQTVKNYFDASIDNFKDFHKEASRISRKEFNKIQFGANLKSLFATLLKCSETQIKLPACLINKKINFFFKSDSENPEKVFFDKLTSYLKLKQIVTKQLQNTLLIKVKDTTKLNQYKQSSPIGGWSTSDDFKVIAIKNVSLKDFASLIEHAVKMPVELKNLDQYPGSYSITINNENFRHFEKSMENYGFKITKSKKLLELYTFEKEE